MNKINQHRLRWSVLAALSAGAMVGSTHAADLIAGWDFERVEADGVSIKSAAGNYTGTITGSAILTDAGGGRPGAGGGKGFDVSEANPGYLLLEATGTDNPFNIVAAEDSATVVLWQKNLSNINSSSFWGVAESQARGFQFHVPWSDGTIYFDTSGCCGADTRLSANVTGTFPDHDWLEWHHYAFVKNGTYKAIYVDGALLIEGEGYSPLPTDFNALYIGAASDQNQPDGVIDDFAIFKGALTQQEIAALAGGASPFVPPTDTDKDGMPDDWEDLYGFNKNDPSDGPLDFDKDGVSNVDEYKAGTNPVDVTPPTLQAAVGSASFTTVTLTFSENLDPVTAADASKYSITPSLAVTAASVSKNVVTLTTAAQTPGATAYTVNVSGVLDTSKNPVPAGSNAKFYSYLLVTDGALKFSFWGDISGTPVTALTDDPRYPATPDRVGTVFSFNSRDYFPNDSTDNYGATIEGFVTPTETADYHFFLRSDDASELYISSNDSPDNLVLQAYETGCCDAFKEPGSDGADETTFTPISMQAGRKYFVRVIYKEGGGGDYAQVAWRKSTDTTPAASLQPISSAFISSATPLPAPPEGAFTAVSPANNARNVSPATSVAISHRDGKTAWTASNVTMKFDGVAVTPTFSKVGNVLTIRYTPPALLASASVHTVTLEYPDAGGVAASSTFSFTVLPYSGSTKDKVAGYPGLIQGSAVYTADRGGHTGNAGDYAIDLTMRGGPVVSYDRGLTAAINAATANDELSVSFWQKRLDISDGSAFVVYSPTTGNGRIFHSHAPWSNQNIYFDTTGCCDTTTQRISADIITFPGYTGDAGWWTNNWNHFVFTKKGPVKNIYINGEFFLSGESTGVMATDAEAFYMGSGSLGTELARAIIDDFAIFGKELSQADAKAIFDGSLPSAITGKGLIAHWDYNDAGAAVAPTISVNGNVITFTGTLQSASSLNGAFAPVAGATSPYTIPASVPGDRIFYRSSN